MAELFESNWSATKDALLEGLSGSKKSTLDVVLKIAKDIPRIINSGCNTGWQHCYIK